MARAAAAISRSGKVMPWARNWTIARAGAAAPTVDTQGLTREEQPDVLHHDGDSDGGQDDHAELDLDRGEPVERPHRARSAAA